MSDSEWKPASELQMIAVAIGHHFWNCKTDQEAMRAGMDCAIKVEKALEEGER